MSMSSDHEILASIPLLAPFQITIPANSSHAALLRSIIDEILAYEALLAIQTKEAKIHVDLQKARSGNTNNNANTNATTNATTTNNNTNTNATTTNINTSNNTNNNTTKKSKRSTTTTTTTSISSSSSSTNNNTSTHKGILQLEFELDLLSTSLLTAQSTLHSASHLSRTLLQFEYSKLIPTLDPHSTHHQQLEQSMDQLLREDRVIYLSEMVRVLHKVGSRRSFSNANPLHDLPLLRLFLGTHPNHAHSTLLSHLTDELFHSRIAKQLHHHLQETKNPTLRPPIRHAEDASLHHAKAATDAIQKYYRKRSIALHPDRMGEGCREEFEGFTLARNVLVEASVRRSYLDEMMGVYAYGGEMVERAHEGWMARHFVGEKEVRKRLEGGLGNALLGAPLLRVNRVVEVSVPVPKPIHEFYSRVRSIVVGFRSTHGVSRTMRMERCHVVRGVQVSREGYHLNSQISVGEIELEVGVWEVSWWADLDSSGVDPLEPKNATRTSTRTRLSCVATLDVVDVVRERNLNEFYMVELQCKKIKGQLQNELQKFHSQQNCNRYGSCHESLVRAARKHRYLKEVMDRAGQSSEVHVSLGQLLASSRGTLSQIDDVKKRREKKDDVRRFKAFVAGVLESDDPISWIKGFTSEDLEMEGGDVNKLYQLFIEGKRNVRLLVDSDMYRQASLRIDIFSPKQVKDLESRGKAVAIQEAKEDEDAYMEDERQKTEQVAREKAFNDSESREKWSLVGNTVLVRGLESAVGMELNYSSARVLNYSSENDRYEIECIDSGEKAFLRREHLFGDRMNESCRIESTIEKKTLESLSAENEAGSSDQCTCENEVESTSNLSLSCLPDCTSPAVIKYCEKDTAIQVTPEFQPTTGIVDNNTNSVIYISSSLVKKLADKQGKSMNAFQEWSGVEFQIMMEQMTCGYVPVHVMGKESDVTRAIELIRDTAGLENVRDTLPDPGSSTSQPIHIQKSASLVAESGQNDSNSKHMSPNPQDLLRPPGFFHNETEFSHEIQSRFPSEIGIGVQRELTNDGSVSSLNDRSQSSKTMFHSQLRLPENNQLLVFLLNQHSCIKGNPEEFYRWLVKSEDIDTMEALKEAVTDDEYLDVTLKNGDGSSGVKGYKRMAFRRAVVDYQESTLTDVTASSTRADPRDDSETDILPGMESSAFLPSFLYNDHENSEMYSNEDKSTNRSQEDPPTELLCPITQELMTNDPVVAADGATYERSAIENWFRNQIAVLSIAREMLISNPHLKREREIVECGVRSPVYGTPMNHLFLTSNTGLRNLARAHGERVSRSLDPCYSPSNEAIFPFGRVSG